MNILTPHLAKVRVPSAGDRIYKDECVFSFDTPESDTGLYVCLNTFLGFGRDFVESYHKRTSNAVFLHLRRIKKEVPKDESGDNEGQPKKITKLAIGIEGGFNPEAEVKRYQYEDLNAVVILPSFSAILLPNAELPEQVLSSISTILAADSASKLEELQALSGTWDGEKLKESKHTRSLVQSNNGIKVAPRGWKCEKCDLKENLWLCLTDGSILCGRKFFDGSGGNNHALDHFKDNPSHPLAVKLGTITANGADVYSYDEDEMVEDPLLTQHLAHFGINVLQMEKTDKSMVELEIDYNQKIGEWSVIQEADTQLTPLFGPGFTGLANLGNSCYLNSVIQVLFSIPEFEKPFYPPLQIFAVSPRDPTQDFNTQMAKLAYGLLSGKYSKEPLEAKEAKEQDGIKPTMFKNLIGKGHPEFSTKRQQDAQEFFLHLINTMERNYTLGGGNGENPTQCLKFQVEERIQCLRSHKVNYTTRTEYILPLPIPLEKAVNMKEVLEFEAKKRDLEAKGLHADNKDIVRPRITLEDCFTAFAENEEVADFFSTAINDKTSASKASKMKTFPDYLMIQLKKFTLGDDWVPKKLDVAIDVPDRLDLARLRGKGLQPNEEKLPEFQSPSGEDNSNRAVSAITFDGGVIAQLIDMGFTLDICKWALHSTKNQGLELALNWLCDHQTEPEYLVPFTLDMQPSAGGGGSSAPFTPDATALEMLKSMGIPEDQANRGLKETNNNVERAVDWIFSHQEELSAPQMMEVSDEQSQATAGGSSGQAGAAGDGMNFSDGSEKYRLVAFISHMGTSTMCGHYVCHILKPEKGWVIFNDNKVAQSEHPPKELAYLYLYRRV